MDPIGESILKISNRFFFGPASRKEPPKTRNPRHISFVASEFGDDSKFHRLVPIRSERVHRNKI